MTIGYIVRQGRCYATMGVHGTGPLNSTLYYNTLFSKMTAEAERVTETMKRIGVCGM